MIRAALALIATASCAEPTVESCADNLSGIWRAAPGRDYHVVDRGGSIEVFPQFADRATPFEPTGSAPDEPRRSASYVRLVRGVGMPSGTVQHYRTNTNSVCRVRAGARAVGCSASAFELRIQRPGALDYTDCSQSAPVGEASLTLRRVRALP